RTDIDEEWGRRRRGESCRCRGPRATPLLRARACGGGEGGIPAPISGLFSASISAKTTMETSPRRPCPSDTTALPFLFILFPLIGSFQTDPHELLLNFGRWR